MDLQANDRKISTKLDNKEFLRILNSEQKGDGGVTKINTGTLRENLMNSTRTSGAQPIYD